MLRRVLTVVLLAFVVGTVVWAYARPRADVAPVPGAVDAPAAQLVVYYFHGDRRCATCTSIEAGARRAVAAGFAAEVGSGALALVALNTDRPENAHFVDDFGLVASSLVVAAPDGSAWRVLDRVWELVADESAFDAYVCAAVRDASEGRW